MEEPIERLIRITNLLGPGLTLELDKASFPTFFGGEIGREASEIEAQKFAEKQHCSFSSDGKVARFSRAYAKALSGARTI